MNRPVEWIAWLQVLGVAVAIAALVFTAWWALFADRAKGRRRCPRCWYDLAYSPGMLCAECGHEGRSERDFHRTRRRPRLAVAAILACIGIVIAVDLQASQRGYAFYLPTRALLWLLPLSNDSSSPVFTELVNRGQSGRLSPGQWRSLIDRCAEGDWWAEPVTEPWRRKYGDFLDAWRAMFINDAALEAPLASIPLHIDARTRDAWPQDAPVVVNLRVSDWWPAGYECRLRVTPRVPGAQPVTLVRHAPDGVAESSFPLALGPLDPAATELTIDFQIERRRAERFGRRVIDHPDAAWRPWGTQTITLKTKVQGSLDQALQPIGGPALDAAVARVFANGVRRWERGPSPVRFNIYMAATLSPAFNDAAIGVSAELLYDGRTARRLNVWWRAGVDQTLNDPRNYSFEVAFEDQELLRKLDPADPRWTMRVRSDPILALRAGNALKYWKGDIEVPLIISTPDADAAPRRQWEAEDETIDD